MVAGRYEMVASNNYGEFLKAIGVDMMLRNLAEKFRPTVEITEDGERMTLQTLTALKNIRLDFTLGQTFDEEILDGRRARSVITQESNQLLQVSEIDNERWSVDRTFSDGSMKEVLQSKGVVATRVYQKL